MRPIGQHYGELSLAVQSPPQACSRCMRSGRHDSCLDPTSLTGTSVSMNPEETSSDPDGPDRSPKPWSEEAPGPGAPEDQEMDQEMDPEMELQVVLAGHLGDADTAERALTDPSPKVRAAALSALRRLGRLSSSALRQATGDSDPSVRRRAAELAARDAAVSLVPLFGDSDPLVVEMAAWAAGEQQDTGAVEALSNICRSHEDPLCREAAAAALGAIGDPRGLDAILAAVSDTTAVRRRAVLALAPFEGPVVEQALRGALSDRDWQVRQAAEDLLDP